MPDSSLSIIVYLDIDGVVNALSNDSHLVMRTGYQEYKEVTVRGIEGREFPIRYAPRFVEAVNSLSLLPGVKFKWATTWVDYAAKNLSPAIGLIGHDWEILRPNHGEMSNAEFWKLRAVQEDFRHEKPDFAFWIDDDLSFVDDALRWVDQTSNLFGISPTSEEGLKLNELNGLVLAIRELVFGNLGER